MKWLFKWVKEGIQNYERDLENGLKEAYADRNRISPGLAINLPKLKSRGNQIAAATAGNEVYLNQQPMHFKIYPATGGHIVEYSYYDDKHDRNNQALHLIPSELDLGTELAKIMTLEALKR